MARRNAAPRSARSQSLPHEVLDQSVAESISTALDWWEATDLLDDLASDDLTQDLDTIARCCDDLNLRYVGDVIEHSATIMTSAAEVEHLARFHSAAESQALHRVRNHLAAVLAATALIARRNPTLALASLPAPPPRAGGSDRPCEADEILLLRHRALYCLTTGGRNLRSGLQYAISEAGAIPYETTTATPGDFDALRAPRALTLRGATYHHQRTVALPRWSLGPVAQGLDEFLAQDEQAAQRRVAYGGTKSGATASAAASIMLRRTFIAAGLTEDCAEPQGIVRWRGRQTIESLGYQAAIALLGKDNADQVHRYVYGEESRKQPDVVIAEVDIDNFW